MTSQVAISAQHGGHAPYDGKHGNPNQQDHPRSDRESEDESSEAESSAAETSDIPKGVPLDGHTPGYVRAGFVRKVYSILAVQLALTFVIGFCVNSAVQDNKALVVPLYYGSLIGMVAMMCVLCCCSDLFRIFPYNYVILFMYTLAMSVLVGMVTTMYTGPSVLLAVATTAVVFACLTAYACCTTTDWTGIGPYLFGGLVAMIAFGFMMQLFCMFGMCPGTTMQKIYSAFGVLLFTLYIVYDTQLIIGGNHKKHQFGVDDYAFAALNLYMDIMNLFLYILQLVGNRSS